MKSKKIMKDKKNILYLGIILLVTIFILCSLFINDRYKGHDTIFHVSNIIKLSETISLDNVFGFEIIKYEFKNFNYGSFGYGVGLFYPRIPHLIASYFYLLLDDVYLSMKIVYFITTLLSGILTYFLANKIFKNKNISLLSSIIYITIPYHVCEIYIRDAFAENFMFMVLPMIFLGLYHLKDGNYIKFYILFILGYIIGINSHLVSMVFNTIFIGIFILYYRKYFFKKDKFIALLKSTLIVTVMVLPFLVTLLEHKSLGIYRVFTPLFVDIIDVKSAVLDISSLYTSEVIYDDIMPYFNLSSVVLFVLTTISLFFNKNDKLRNDMKIFLLLIFIIVNFMCSNILWDYVPELILSIQFPWRLLVFCSLMMALYVPGIFGCDVSLFKGRIFNNLGNNKICRYLMRGGLVVLIVFIIYEGYGNIRYYTDEEISSSDSLNSIYSLGYQKEYYPYIKQRYGLVSSYYFPDRDYEIISNDDIFIEIVNDNFPSMEFVVDNLNDESVIELPRTFYLGYELVNEDNELIDLDCSNGGLLEAKIDSNGMYKLNYVGTKLSMIAKFIRLVAVFIISVVLVVKFVKWKRRRLQF